MLGILSQTPWSEEKLPEARGMCDDKRQQPDVDDMSGSWGWVNPGDPSGSVPSARKFHAAVQSNNGMLVAHLQCSGSWGGAVRSRYFLCDNIIWRRHEKILKHPFDVHR